jgi:hypothetical protein
VKKITFNNMEKIMIRFLALCLVSMILNSCWIFQEIKGSKPKKKDDPRISEVREKFDFYLAEIVARQDSHGFIMTDECDALLFSGLVKAAGARVNLRAAMDGGRFYRRPLSYTPCYPGFSRSSMSRDMLLGVLWGIWHDQDGALLKELLNRLIEDKWILGEGDPATLVVTPALQATIGDLDAQLNKNKHPLLQNYPQAWNTSVTDFRMHLQMLHMELRAQIHGGVTDFEKDIFQFMAQAEPNNALAQALHAKHNTGDFGEALDLLLNETWWPSNRLPTSFDRKEPWLTQRQHKKDGAINPDWLPNTQEDMVRHSGGDYLFAAMIILKHFGAL